MTKDVMILLLSAMAMGVFLMLMLEEALEKKRYVAAAVSAAVIGLNVWLFSQVAIDLIQSCGGAR